jgi:hypothetical protein
MSATPTNGPTSPNTSIPQTDEPVRTKLIWNEQTEDLVASWGDIASCYKWLHDQAYHKYNKINYRMSIPIIILSTLTGTVSVGMASLVPADYVNLAQQAVGGVNIITGIITTLQNFFRFAQLSEGHQHASVGWSKLERNIRIELKVDRKFRKDADSFLKVCRSDYDRLLEQSPVIPKEIIAKFKLKFKDSEIRKPDICDNLQSTEVAPVIMTPRYEPAIDEEPRLNNSKQEEILNEIKDLLSESRLVPIGMKDHEIPRWRKSSEINKVMPHVAPRKSFMGAPKEPIHIDKSNISVKDIIKRFGGSVAHEKKEEKEETHGNVHGNAEGNVDGKSETKVEDTTTTTAAVFEKVVDTLRNRPTVARSQSMPPLRERKSLSQVVMPNTPTIMATPATTNEVVIEIQLPSVASVANVANGSTTANVSSDSNISNGTTTESVANSANVSASRDRSESSTSSRARSKSELTKYQESLPSVDVNELV